MTQFTDADGRKWEIEVSVPAIKRVRQRLDGVELLNLIDPQSSLMSRLFSDPCFLCDVLFVLCAPEAEKRNVTDEDFGARCGATCWIRPRKRCFRGSPIFSPSGGRRS